MRQRQYKKLSHNGFGTLELVLIIAAIAAVIGIGVFVWSNRATKLNEKSDAAKSAVQTKKQEPAQANSPNTQYKLLTFSIDAPAGWTSTTKDSNQGDGGPPISTTTTTSPAGTVLEISQDYGGYGGACEPAASDQPFKAGNQCPTLETTSIEPLQATVYDKNGHRIPVLLTTLHYAAPAGDAQYNICLQASTDPDHPVEANKPVMNFVRNVTSISIYNADGKLGIIGANLMRPMYFTVCAKGTSASFFTGADGKAVQQSLRSFRFTNL